MSDNKLTEEMILGILREKVGVEVAERQKEAVALTAAAIKQHGSIEAAKAKGEETDLFVKYGLVPKRDEKAVNHATGRLVSMIAKYGNGIGAMQNAASHCKAQGDEYGYALASFVVQKAPQYLTDFASGGALVPEAFSNDFIDLLYNSLSVAKLGSTIVDAPTGSMTMPFMETGSTANWIAEGQNITPSEVAFGTMQLNTKKLAAIVAISNDLLKAPSANADRIVEGDMRMQLELALDLALLRGNGVGRPKGIENWADAANLIDQSGTTLQAKVDDLTELQYLVVAQNVPLMGAGYIMHPRTEYNLMSTLDADGAFIFRAGLQAGTLLGQRYVSSTQVPINLSGDGDESKVYFGAFAHHLIARTGGLEVLVVPNGAYHNGSAVVSGLSTDVTPIRAMLRADAGARYRGKEFSVLSQVTWGT